MVYIPLRCRDRIPLNAAVALHSARSSMVSGSAGDSPAALGVPPGAEEAGIAHEEIEERITTAADARAAEREALIGAEQARAVEKNFLLQMVDMQWREHLMHLDHLRNVIGLRGYGQRDPLNEYKTEAFSLFENCWPTCARTSPAG